MDNIILNSANVGNDSVDKIYLGDVLLYEKIIQKPLILEFTTKTANEIVRLPIYTNVNCRVNWGDGNYTETIMTNNPTHSFAVPGIYEVSIKGTCNSLMNCSDNVTKVISWGDNNMNLTSMDNAFYTCTELTNIPSDEFGLFTNVKTFYQTFFDCNGLTSIPSGLFEYCSLVTNFSTTFSNCSSLINIPSDLFKNCVLAKDFTYTFVGLIEATEIPSDLFKNCVLAKDFTNTFQKCEKLLTIPENLFNTCIDVTIFDYTFNECSGLTNIPEKLFDNCKMVKSFDGIFSECIGLTGKTPTTNGLELWERAGQPGYPTIITGIDCFAGCDKLNNICSVPEKWRKTSDCPLRPLILEFTTKATNESVTLPLSGNVNCTIDWGDGYPIENITINKPRHTYPEIGVYTVSANGVCDKLDMCSRNVTKVISWGDNKMGLTSIVRAFYGSENLTSISSDEFGAFTNVTNSEETFGRCSGLTSIPIGLFDNCHLVTNFTNVFYGCSGLTGSIPSGLFDNCPLVTEFTEAFDGCTGLTGTTPTTNGVELWDRAGKPGYPSSMVGSGCFRMCNGLSNFSSIPSYWK